MSKTTQDPDPTELASLESGLAALQSSPEFRGPVEELDGHGCNDHFAQIYESPEERFSASVPFIRHGIERGDRCMYVVDESSESEVVEAFQAAGVDVDDAVSSGTLTFHTVQDTYLRNGRFDPDEMIDFYAETVTEATGEYEALRIAAETTWLQEETTTVEQFMEYESKINDLFADEDCLALCQYDRNGFPPEVIRDIVQTHPHLIYEGSVCHNVYYTPPAEFFGPDQPAHEVDRMLGTLRERTEAKTELQAREQFLQDLHGVTADPTQTFDEKVQALFDLGCDLFGMELGAMARVDPETDRFEIERTSRDHDHFTPGLELDLSETYCTAATAADGPAEVTDPEREGYENITVKREFGIQSYLGTHITVSGDEDRTFFFVTSEPRHEPVTETERVCLDLMGQWVQYELEHRQRERFLRESYEITASQSRSFEEKLEALFDLGCKQFGLDLGALNRVYPDDDRLEIEYAAGEHSHFEVGRELPLSETYCQAAADIKEAVDVSNPSEDGFDDLLVYEDFSVDGYLGTYIPVDGGDDRTLAFVPDGSTERSFSEQDKAYIELMGQWVKHELERRQREQDQHELYETTAATELAFDEKVRRILELGRDRYDLEFGLLTRTDEETYEVVQAAGGGDPLEPGVSGPIGDSYCRKVVDDGETVCVTHAANEGWADDPAYEAQGLECYLGTEVRVGRETYGTLCFGSFEPRNKPVTDAEETFLELMGQCVSYELEREHHEAQLSALNEMGRHLMDAESRADVAEIAVQHATETLQLPVAAFVGYDERTGRLSPVAQTPRAEDELPTTALCERGSGDLWEAFVSGETRLLGDVADVSGAGDEISGVLAVPLGSQGLFVTAATSDDGFPRAERDFVEATAATIEAACTRADRERQLQEREETLEAQNETLERLNRVNDIIRSIDEALVKASSRSKIDEVVCEQLADVGPYELAWIGDHDPVAQTVTPRESAGTARGYLDDITIQTDESPEGQGPTGTAVRTREPQVVNDVLEDRSFEPWRQDALNRGYHATMALPLVYEETLYGVLTVYAGQPGVFDGLERAVLDELTDNIAYAINAVESKKALMSDEVTELEFTVGDRSLGVVELIRETGCEFSQESLVPREDGRLQSFFSTSGTTEEAVLDITPRLPITDVGLISEHEEDGERVCLFEGTLTEDSLAATVLEHGGRIRRIEATDESATVTVHLAADANVREFTEMLRRSHPSLELTAQRTRERPRRTVSEVRAALTEELTDRQLEALQTAYVSGYFDQPRARTASEIAETMEIAQPTFNSHLRTAHRKLCRQLFDDRPLEN